ncbi:hypothetical protein MRB53_020481 [Persea americana]|uniref:Uncharacterized protein n=1 Tax=Persea americana TaxID=3435 RepID=A0ACC2L134_PERAE|nr:hypothetical protein MRB53_020481 [Persea americana]
MSMKQEFPPRDSDVQQPWNLLVTPTSGISLRGLNLRCCEVRQIGEGDFVGRRRTEEELERVNSILFGLAEGTGILFGLAANKSEPEKPAPVPKSPL